MRRACLIVAKAPVPGRAKTRLVPPLSSEDAAALYAGFLLDTVALASDLQWECLTVVHPRGSRASLEPLLSADVYLYEQPGDDLRDALTSAFAHHFERGFERVVLVGSDSPTLPRHCIEDACAELDQADVTIGPCADGGYYLIGMRQAHLDMFEEIAWSTSRVYEQTLANAARLGLRVHAVDEWYDVDSPTDLETLRRELQRRPAVAPCTRAALARVRSAVPTAGHE